MSIIHYSKSDLAWSGFERYVESLIRENARERVLEVGGGANPTLAIDRIRVLGITYTLLDISAAELSKAPPGYQTQLADIGAKGFGFAQQLRFCF